MLQEPEYYTDFLKNLRLFASLDDEQIAGIASWFTVVTVEKGEQLLAEGQLGESFYIILDGRVGITRPVGGGGMETAVLVSSDYFGEDALLYERPRPASVAAIDDTKLLSLDRERFYELLREFPEIEPDLIRTAESQELIRKTKFDWLGQDEVIYQIARKDEAILVVNLIGPFLVGLLSIIVVFYASRADSDSFTWIAGIISSAFLALVAIGWGIWSWLDWGNDYYIVTNQRVVWIEKVIGLYESRDEAPLGTILAVNVTTSLLGRLLGFGNVIVRTYTGQIAFQNVGQPYQMAAAVEEYWQRVRERSEQEEAQEMEEAIRGRLRRMDEGEVERTVPVKRPLPPVPPKSKRVGFLERYFSHFLQMRFEEGNVITYRKYWTVLVAKTWLPTLGLLVVSGVAIALVVLYFFDRIESPSPITVFLVAGFLFLFLLPWWFYHYVDWRNDIYQVTDRYVFDIERKPLGTEVKKSAPLESILSLEHRRVGLLGYLLNFGNVTINVGDAKLDFVGVHNPARVQQDIFNRMHALRRQKEQAEMVRDRERLAEALSMYHRNVENSRHEEDFTHIDEESGFEESGFEW